MIPPVGHPEQPQLNVCLCGVVTDLNLTVGTCDNTLFGIVYSQTNFLRVSLNFSGPEPASPPKGSRLKEKLKAKRFPHHPSDRQDIDHAKQRRLR